jgi:MFS family permease
VLTQRRVNKASGTLRPAGHEARRRYVVVRGATGAGAAGVAAVASLIALEPVGAAWRGAAAMAAAALAAAGAAALPGLAWVLPHWRGETFAVAALQAAFLLLLLPSVPESPRWLLHRGRKVLRLCLLARALARLSHAQLTCRKRCGQQALRPVAGAMRRYS